MIFGMVWEIKACRIYINRMTPIWNLMSILNIARIYRILSVAHMLESC